MNYLEALRLLGVVRKFGSKLGLEKMRRLAEALGNPQDSLRFIHIAGTNGKGSTAAFLASMLRCAGFRVGLYTSPHLCTIRERIQINFRKIREEDFARLLQRVLRAAKEGAHGEAELGPTFFETLTAMALLYFREQEVDWVVWETGLGGRLDATNIVNPEACVLTHIGLDHEAYLGSTLEEIAWEKAGILKPGVPAVVAVEEPAAYRVIEQRAQELRAPMLIVEKECPWHLGTMRSRYQEARIGAGWYRLGLVGEHQVRNAASGVALLQKEFLKVSLPSGQWIERGLEQVPWPGRFQVLAEDPPLVVDGAHNPSAARALRKTWAAVFGDTPYHLCLGIMADKDARGIAWELESGASRVTVVRPPTERSMDPRVLARQFRSVPVEIAESWADCRERFLRQRRQPVLITGSLYLVGEVLADFWGWEKEFAWNELLTAPSRNPGSQGKP